MNGIVCAPTPKVSFEYIEITKHLNNQKSIGSEMCHSPISTIEGNECNRKEEALITPTKIGNYKKTITAITVIKVGEYIN